MLVTAGGAGIGLSIGHLGDRTSWLRRQASSLCISKADLLNFIVAQRDLGRRSGA